MPPDEPEACVVMVEASCAQPNRIKLTPKVILVARSTLTAEVCMESGSTIDARPQRRMAVQALTRRDASLADLVTIRAIANALKLGVNCRKIARRYELRAHVLRSDSDEQQQARTQPTGSIVPHAFHCPAITGS